jgi:MIP family channel proteins
MDQNLRPYLAELVGTFALVFLSAGAVVADQLAAFTWYQPTGIVAVEARTDDNAPRKTHPVQIGQPPLGVTGIALTAGLIYAAALAWTGTTAGGYLNPAVTLMLWVFKRLDGARTVWLIVAQVLGATLAGLAVRVLLASREDVLIASRLGTPHLNLDAFAAEGLTLPTVLKGIGVELGLTFLLVCAIFGTSLAPRALRHPSSWTHRLSALWIGLTLAACVFVGFALTGAALNPARWLGPAVWELTVAPLAQNAFRDHMVYWIGPIVGALLAGTLYTSVLLPAEAEHSSTPPATEKPAPVTSTLYRTPK